MQGSDEMKKAPSLWRFLLGWRLIFAIIYVVGFFAARGFLPQNTVPVFSFENKSVPPNVTVADKETFDISSLISAAVKTTPEK